MLYLASTVLVPISNVMFALPCMPQHQPVHTTDVYGLLVIMLGLTLYRAGWADRFSVIRKVVFSADKRTEPLFDIEGDVPTPILREVAQSPGVFRTGSDGRGSDLPSRPARDAAAHLRAAGAASSATPRQDERADPPYAC